MMNILKQRETLCNRTGKAIAVIETVPKNHKKQ